LVNNKVLPQTYTESNPNSFDETLIRRPPIKIAEPFANGGAVKMAEGGEVDQAELDRMRLELSNSPVIQATPQSPIQRGIGTLGGYMDRAGQFVSKSLEPIAETHPVKHFLGELLLADTLKSAGTALQDYTKTGREYTEDNPYKRAPITGSGQTMSLDPRMLDVIGFADPVTRLGIKAGRAGVKAATPFAKDVGEMASELYMKGDIPGMPSPNMYAVSPDGKPSKVLAPANEIGFYSPTEAAALNVQRKSGSGQAFLNDIMKGENVKSDEISAMGLDTFLKDKKNVTADEVRDYIAQNKIQLGETVYDNSIKENGMGVPEHRETKFSNYALPGGENYREIVLTLPTKKTAPPEMMYRSGDDIIAKTSSFVDGGFSPDAVKAAAAFTDNAGSVESGLAMQDRLISQGYGYTQADKEAGQILRAIINGQRQRASAANAEDAKSTYKSSHWDEPNPLAHLRVSDRVTDGKKTLLVDEVQSDWHQQGRERGYVSPDDKTPAQLERELTAVTRKRSQLLEEAAALPDSELDKFLVLNNQIKQLGEQATQLNRQWTDSLNSPSKVPDAPYKDDWYQLTLRRAIKEAVDGGYDRVALPTGARVNERFDLSQQIDRIDYNKNDDGTYSMSAVKDGQEVFSKEDINEKELSGIVGKDIAKKIVGDEGSSAPKADRWEAEDDDVPEFKSLSGLDLEVGGEGNKKYYDEIYPNYLKKLGKKYGAQVGDTNLDLPMDFKGQIPQAWGGADFAAGKITREQFLKMNPDLAKKYSETVHYMDITPAMRKEFSTGIHMKRGGKVQFAKSLDAMRHELTKAK
jgi:hypothetical protein